MPKKEFEFKVEAKMILIHEQGAPTSQLKEAKVLLTPGKGMDKSMYLDGRGLPRKEALKPITQTLLQGLMVNIKHGSEKGWWKDHEHLKYVIEELQKSFVDTNVTSEGLF